MARTLLNRDERNNQVKATGFVYCSSGHLVEKGFLPRPFICVPLRSGRERCVEAELEREVIATRT